MSPVMSADKTIIPLSSFGNGSAGEIFAEVKRSGTKLVVDDDDRAIGIVMTPEEYMKMSDDHDNIRLLAIAEDRLKHFDPSRLISAEELYKEFGITDEDIEGWEDVELE
ncbi:MAG: hypothetical protein IJS28_03700 [Synergistaceae bacterium]|nr:hypothetical protein [Synergistaceae bacterium]